MVEPVLRISISPSGMVKIDAAVLADADRPRVLAFYAEVLSDILAFDSAVRRRAATSAASQRV
jgi:hypothetical protein